MLKCFLQYSTFKSYVFMFATADQSVWASQARQEARTWRPPSAASQLASRDTLLSGLSLMWTVSVNSMPWHHSAMKPRVPVAS